MSVMQQLSDTVVMKQGNGIKANTERSKVRLTTFLIYRRKRSTAGKKLNDALKQPAGQRHS